MRSDETRVRVNARKCDLLIDALDLLVASSTDGELDRIGDDAAELRVALVEGAHRARTLRRVPRISGIAVPPNFDSSGRA